MLLPGVLSLPCFPYPAIHTPAALFPGWQPADQSSHDCWTRRLADAYVRLH